jgi:hypothetical protein
MIRTYQDVVVGVRRAVETAVPGGTIVAVISRGDDDLIRFDRHVGWHFPTLKDLDSGEYPADSAEAVGQVQDVVREGARYLVIPATSAWWLDHYIGLRRYLDEQHDLLSEGDGACVIYALDESALDRGSEGLPQAADGRPDLVESPIVIYGAPRSGTTYLRHLLVAHPDIFITNETRIFTWAHAAREQVGRSLNANRDQFERHLRDTLPGLIRDFYADLAPPTARYWGDKNPHYARPDPGCLEAIEALFPAAKFIHVIRDGRDVVSSLVRKTGPGGRSWAGFEAAHHTWLRHVSVGRAFGVEVPSHRYLELRYEDLIADDLEASRRILGFLDLEVCEPVERFCRQQRHERTPLSEPTRDLSRGAAASDWAEIFTPSERLRSLELLGPTLVDLGYETESSLEEARETLERQRAEAHVERATT